MPFKLDTSSSFSTVLTTSAIRRGRNKPRKKEPDLVCDVLLLYRRVSLGIDEGWVSHQVSSVLHDEAPAPQQRAPVRETHPHQTSSEIYS